MCSAGLADFGLVLVEGFAPVMSLLQSFFGLALFAYDLIDFGEVSTDPSSLIIEMALRCFY